MTNWMAPMLGGQESPFRASKADVKTCLQTLAALLHWQWTEVQSIVSPLFMQFDGTPDEAKRLLLRSSELERLPLNIDGKPGHVQQAIDVCRAQLGSSSQYSFGPVYVHYLHQRYGWYDEVTRNFAWRSEEWEDLRVRSFLLLPRKYQMAYLRQARDLLRLIARESGVRLPVFIPLGRPRSSVEQARLRARHYAGDHGRFMQVPADEGTACVACAHA